MFTDNEDDDDDFDDGKNVTGRRRRGQGGDDRDRPLPPLLARVNGQIEVGGWGESAGNVYVSLVKANHMQWLCFGSFC